MEASTMSGSNFSQLLTTLMPTTVRRGRPYPLCREWLCDIYFTRDQIISNAIILGRIGIGIIILLLGTKMEKDFMRSITTTIFLTILAAESFTLYCEIVNYLELFTASAKDSKQFIEQYIRWTRDLVNVLFSYNDINSMVMLVLLLYCCRIATHPGNRINAFPTNTMCLILQIIPFFLSILTFVEGVNNTTFMRVLGSISRVVTVVSFLLIVGQIFYSFVVLMRELPYEAATSLDMQVRDARSRLAWTLVYMIIPTLMLAFSAADAVMNVLNVQGGPNTPLRGLTIIVQIVKYLANFHRPTYMVIITMAFLPPYRRAVPLLFCCCSFCPQIHVEPLPRKPTEMSLMYRYADI
ncbi:unnamed protein product [Caenorhabditis auriculariae]|uniref:Uncharacterized protein n=1 Tax=Caenorhabditis auriculariae TaxID=2777116 RepID=A0A8S1HEA9_9PELO|nr:unnamed protein product [Caenorhabditis auriculariae]